MVVDGGGYGDKIRCDVADGLADGCSRWLTGSGKNRCDVAEDGWENRPRRQQCNTTSTIRVRALMLGGSGGHPLLNRYQKCGYPLRASFPSSSQWCWYYLRALSCLSSYIHFLFCDEAIQLGRGYAACTPLDPGKMPHAIVCHCAASSCSCVCLFSSPPQNWEEYSAVLPCFNAHIATVLTWCYVFYLALSTSSCRADSAIVWSLFVICRVNWAITSHLPKQLSKMAFCLHHWLGLQNPNSYLNWLSACTTY